MLNKINVKQSESLVRFCSSSDGLKFSNDIELNREWQKDLCLSTLKNNGQEPVWIEEIVLFKVENQVNGDMSFYGEGYNMLSQYGGTLNSPEDLGSHSDHGHYKMPETEGYATVYNMMLLSDKEAEYLMMAFVSCNRFRGEIRFNDKSLEVVLVAEGMTIAPQEVWELEVFFIDNSSDRNSLYRQVGSLLNEQHPRLSYPKTPAGWCSWYCYGPGVTEQDIFDNMKVIEETVPEFSFIQIDDGYQAYMGDWLIPKPTFANDIAKLCKNIKARGFRPAIWVAPFIAEAESNLFREHPEWFVKDEEGNPLPSDQVTFGGWRHGPWYMLDGTHPEARAYLKHVFRVMKEEWGCEYFKLDAINWGALPFGKRYDENATSVQAYRMGMEAILEGAGEGSFVLGCNAPMWPSLGLVHGMRVSNDIYRKWETFKEVTRQCFLRNWQHNSLWINDPDCIVLDNLEVELVNPNGKLTISKSDISSEEFDFHAAAILATGGMVLSGDIMSNLSDEVMEKLKKIAEIPSTPAEFDDPTHTVGRGVNGNSLMLYIFNWKDEPLTMMVGLDGTYEIKVFWSGEEIGIHADSLSVEGMSAHSALVYECIPVRE